MDIAITIAFLLLFLGGCITAIVFAAKRYGWKTIGGYIFFAILGRVLVHFTMSNSGEVEKNFIPLLGAAAIMWAWPHVVKHRMLDKEQDIEQSSPNDEKAE